MKKIIYSLLLFGSLLTYSSCESTDYGKLIPEEYHKVLYIKDSGQADVTIYNDGSTTDYSFTIVKTGSEPLLTAQASVAPMTQQEIDSDPKYAGNNYIVLSNECFSFRKTELDFSASDQYRIITFKLYPEKINEFIETIENIENSIFIVPIRLTGEEGLVNLERRDVILKPHVKTPSIAFKSSTTTVDVAKDMGTEGELTLEFTVSMLAGIQNKWDFTTEVKVNADLVAEYNQINGTDYQPIPANAFGQLEDIIFAPNYNEAVGVVTLKRSGLLKGLSYLMPLQLGNSSISTIVSSSKIHYIIVKYPLTDEDKIVLTRSMLDSNTGDPGGDSTPLNNLINGNTTDYYHSPYGNPTGDVTYGQYFEMHLDKAIQTIMFDYTTRSNNNATPKIIILFTSNDAGVTWTELVELRDGLPTAGSALYKSKVYSAAAPFTWLRFSVMESKDGILDGAHKNNAGSYWASYAMSEFNLWGM